MPKPTIPDDFDVTRYDKLESYDVAQWYRELLWRYRLYARLNDGKDKVTAHFQKYANKLGTFERFIFDRPLKANEVFDKIDSAVWYFQNPEYKIFDDAFERTKSALIGIPKASDGITPFTIGEFIKLANKLNEGNSPDVLDDDDDIEFESNAKRIDSTPLDSVLFNRTQAIVKIDFTRRNDDLIAAFKAFLKSYGEIIDERVKLQRASNHHKRKKWYHERVVPYIDILLWMKYYDMELTKPEIKTALDFINDDDGDVADLRTLEKTTKGLLSETALDILRRQAESQKDDN